MNQVGNLLDFKDQIFFKGSDDRAKLEIHKIANCRFRCRLGSTRFAGTS